MRQYECLLIASMLLLGVFAISAQDDSCCIQAFKTCGACKDDPDPTKRTDNLTYSWCGVTGYYGQNPNSPNAPAKLKACQECIDRTCPVKGPGKKEEKKEIDRNSVVQIKPENSNYSWCRSVLSSVWVEAMPPRDELVAMAVYDHTGRMGDMYSPDERGHFPGRTWVLAPDNPVYGQRYPWEIYVMMPGVKLMLESNANLRLPCKTPESVGELTRYRIELAGGKMNWFWETITMKQNYDFPELFQVETKEAIGGVKDGLTWIRGDRSPKRDRAFYSFLDASYDSLLVPNLEPPGPPHIVFDTNTPGTTRVTVYRGQVTLTPTNKALKPVIVGPGQSAAVTRTAVSPVTTLAGPTVDGSPTFLGCFKDTNDFDLNGSLNRSSTNTPERCIAACKSRGFKFAGLQYGESCLCGNSYGRYGPATNCNMKCTGDPNQTCGGYSSNAVYSTGSAKATSVSTGCGIGRRWNLTNEFNARATFTRVGDSNIFDAVFNYTDGSRFSEKYTVSLSGRTVTARVDYDYGIGNCIYAGTLSPDGRTASGTYQCSTDPTKQPRWSAEILCQ